MIRAVTAQLRQPGTKPWLLLMAATLITWLLATDHTLIGGATAATVAVLIIAFTKVGLVGRYFMELRTAPAALSLLFTGWLVVTATVIIALYLAK